MNFQKHSSQKSSGKQNKKVSKHFKIYQPYDENFSKLLIDESLSWKKVSSLFPRNCLSETQNLCWFALLLDLLESSSFENVFSLLDNAPIYPTRYIVGCADQKNLFQYFEALCSKSTVLWTVKRKCWPSEPVRLQP